MAHDDWRVTVDLGTAETPVTAAIRDARLGEEVERRMGGRVAVSREGPQLYLYADSRELAEQAAAVVRPGLGDAGADATVSVARWHPVEERWEDGSVPLPSTDAEREAEAQLREADERRESRAQGYPEWEVRIVLESHRDARRLAERLGAEGLGLVRRWRYLLIGAETEADARELAARLEREAPAGARLEVELNGEAVWSDINPFAVFGGLGG